MAGPSIETRIVSAAAIGARDFIKTGRLASVNLMRKFIFIGFNIAIILRPSGNRTPIRVLGLHNFNQKLCLFLKGSY